MWHVQGLIVVQVLENEQEDSETIYRASVALGNIVSWSELSEWQQLTILS